MTEDEDCFLTGTRIMTLRGEIAVETLQPGDSLPAPDGRSAPVVWVGHRHLDCRLHPAPSKVWPVRVIAGAFEDDVPNRDLWLSPDHAIFLNETLIPIRHLVNGTSVKQVPMDRITYYHIELPNHGVVLAEGLYAESYLDAGSRSNFTNGRGPIMPNPDFAARRWEVTGYAPIATSGREIEIVRHQLARREYFISRRAEPDIPSTGRGRVTVDRLFLRLPRRAAWSET